MVARNRDIVYRIRKEGKKNGGKSIHINNLRRYDERKDFNWLDVVIEGEDDNDEENAGREGGSGGGKMAESISAESARDSTLHNWRH